MVARAWPGVLSPSAGLAVSDEARQGGSAADGRNRFAASD